MITIPNEYRQYKWIANIFSKVKGVKEVSLDHTDEGMNLYITNGKKGLKRKAFEFPLRRMFFVDFDKAKNVRHVYDIDEIDDSESMVQLGKAKAHIFFDNIALPAAEVTGE